MMGHDPRFFNSQIITAELLSVTLIETSTGELAKRIIIEGPDCVGKDTFIARLASFIQGNDGHHGLNQITVNQTQWRDKQTGTVYASLAEVPEEFSSDHDAFHERFESQEVPVSQPLFANVISHRSIHSKDGSPESLAFIEALDKGEITDQRAIAEEYLQVHYDLERLAQSLDETLSMVIMNRSLISYYAMQIHALGFDDLLEKWNKLWRFSRQNEALYVRLTAPEEVVRERLAKRQGADFRGEVENFYMAKWQAIEQGFITVQQRKLCDQSITIDTSRTDKEIDEDILRILNWVVRSELNESVLRSTNI